jgi:hypothetical protein
MLPNSHELRHLSGGYMSIIRSFVFLAVIASCFPLLSQEGSKPPDRDPVLLDVVTRAVNAAGGARALASVHDLTESGEITFYWGEGVKGPVKIQTLGGGHFRMEADLSTGKRTWLVNDGNGTRKDADNQTVPLPNENAINLGNLTFPMSLATAVLRDAATDISLVGIENRNGRSTYRLRVKGRLGLSGNPNQLAVVKDLLIDALNFSIVGVEDRPFRTYQGMKLFDKNSEAGGKLSYKPPRAIEFEDFRTINGVLVPFCVSAKLMGQRTFSIHFTSIVFNSNLSPDDFKK